MTKTFTLTKTQLKNGKFNYVVTDQDGNVVSTRTSTREYVACTACGGFYFGRLDLIGKGTHGLLINDRIKTIGHAHSQTARAEYDKWNRTQSFDQYIANAKRDLDIFNSIAYLNH